MSIHSQQCLILSVRADALFIFRLSYIDIADYSFAVNVSKEILLACIYIIVVFIQFGSERQKN